MCRATVAENPSGSVRVCDDLPVALDLRVECEKPPLHVVFAPMSVTGDQTWTKSVTTKLLDEIKTFSPSRIGLVLYYEKIESVIPLTSDMDVVEEALLRNRNVVRTSVSLNRRVDEASEKAIELFQLARRDSVPPSLDPKEVLVLFVGNVGPDDRDYRSIGRAAGLIRQAQLRLFVACSFGELVGDHCGYYGPLFPPGQTGGDYLAISPRSKLDSAMRTEIAALSATASPRELAVTQQLPPFLDYEPGSANVAPASVTRTVTGTQLTWTWPAPPPSAAYSLSYTARPLAEGSGTIAGHSILTRADGSRQRIPMPGRPVTVSGLCITPTAEPTASPTAPPTQTPSATPIPSATPTPSAISTAQPRPLYLPLALHERCIPEIRRVDVVLVIDASTSMDEAAPGGGAKLAAAVQAARSFLGQLQLERGDQAAILAFNADAHLLAPLSGDRSALEAALGDIQTAQQTCLVCAVDAAWAELASPRHAPDHAAVLVLLTDGRSNPRPVEEAVARAAAAKAAGVTIFTIGLGAEVEGEALAAMASAPEGYYHAPAADALAGIYAQIAVALPCPPAAFWGRR